MTSDKLKNWNENVYKLRGRRDKGKNGLESKGRPSGLDSVDTQNNGMDQQLEWKKLPMFLICGKNKE